MDLSRVIIGEIVTEKAARLKAARTHTLRVSNKATKIDVKNALRRYYDVDVTSVRAIRTNSKTRQFGRGSTMIKRKPGKKVMVTLAPKSKPLDIASFKS